MNEDQKQKKTILVVDDVQDNLVFIKKILVPEFTVKTFTDGALALAHASAQPPDLIILDIVMPTMSGYEICKQLKMNKSTRAIPVLFLTSLDDRDNEELGLTLGAVDYILKPFRVDYVLQTVRKYLECKAGALTRVKKALFFCRRIATPRCDCQPEETCR
jgi:putative two-component system response regulator